VPEERGEPPAHVAEWVRSLGRAERALDLGGGDGRLAGLLDAGEVVVADVSAVALRRAGGRFAVVELEPDAPLPLDDSSFDLVLCADTLEHVRDLQLFLSEARRVLRPGGRLAVATPAHGRLTALRLLVRGFESGFDPLSPHLRFLTGRSLRRLLVALGFEVESLRRRGGDLLAVASR
jgi:ubiquinone/menaquinone biosynthesis C-methylase UbiE